jgi:hypothetical protein
MTIPKGTVIYRESNDGIANVEIAGYTGLHIETQEELEALLELVRRPGSVLPLQPAPGSKQPKR